jgi:outer membrane murein-binding lipoprotein Lpp
MEPVLIALAVLAALMTGGVVLLARRLSGLEQRLERLDDLDKLSQRVQRLAGELDRKELNAHLQAKLTEIAESDRRLRAALSELTRKVADLEPQHDAEHDRPAQGPEDIAREHLERMGYRRVRLLSDLGSLNGRSGKVVFEATRDGAAHKGQVVVEDGVARDVNARSAYSAFP